jgi:hypothetical protein
LYPCVLRGDEKKLICRSLARFGASVFFFLEKSSYAAIILVQTVERLKTG